MCELFSFRKKNEDRHSRNILYKFRFATVIFKNKQKTYAKITEEIK